MSICVFFFFQAEDGIRDLVRSRGLGDVYKRQSQVDTLLADQLLKVVGHQPPPCAGKHVANKEDVHLSLIHI